MPDFEIVREKLDQAAEVLEEKDIDLWLTFVRETSQVRDPCLDLLLGLGLTWQSALMISRGGERIAIVGRFDAENVERTGGYTTVVGYDQSVREPLLEHLARLDPRQVALNFSENDPAADGLTHGMFHLLVQTLEGTPYADRIISAEGLVGALRGRKSPAEVSRIKSAIHTGKGKMLTLSARGAYIATKMSLLPQAHVHLQLLLPETKETVDLDAVVNWENHGSQRKGGFPPGYGFRFTHVPSDAAETIRDILQSALPPAPNPIP